MAGRAWADEPPTCNFGGLTPDWQRRLQAVQTCSEEWCLYEHQSTIVIDTLQVALSGAKIVLDQHLLNVPEKKAELEQPMKEARDLIRRLQFKLGEVGSIADKLAAEQR